MPIKFCAASRNTPLLSRCNYPKSIFDMKGQKND